MLKDRRNLMEQEIAKLKKICGEMYIAAIRGTPTHTREAYDAHLERLATMVTELSIIKDMINQGHE
jgi:pyruvate/oxaloacetate carboxyltransferase